MSLFEDNSNVFAAIIAIFIVIVIMTTIGLIIFNPHKPSFQKFTLADGSKIECSGEHRNYCGIYYFNCKDGREYECQTNSKTGW